MLKHLAVYNIWCASTWGMNKQSTFAANSADLYIQHALSEDRDREMKSNSFQQLSLWFIKGNRKTWFKRRQFPSIGKKELRILRLQGYAYSWRKEDLVFTGIILIIKFYRDYYPKF